MKLTPPTRLAAAFTKSELLVVMVVLALLVGLAIPALIQARHKACRIRCISYLAQIGLASRSWAGDHGDRLPMSLSTNAGGTREFIATGETFRHFQVMSNELTTPFILKCLSDRQRKPAKDFGPAFSNTNISYFAGVDASEDKPDMLLVGDRNISAGTRLANGILLLTTNDFVNWGEDLHSKVGNWAFADGSSWQVSRAKLATLLSNWRTLSDVTNRLQMP